MNLRLPMSIRKLFAALLLPALVLTAVATEPLGLMPGLWETTTETIMAAGSPDRDTTKSCVTAAELKDGIFSAARGSDNENCRYDVITATSRRQELKMTCGGETPMQGRMVLEAVDSANAQGSMQMITKRGNVTMKFRSRWLSASCEGADEE
jgi:Protein of unknown function (DUF3617)